MKIFSISLHIFFSLFLLLIIFYIPTITAQSPPARCDNTSTFHTNLKILLSSLSFNTSLHNGFYINTVGQDPYKAYGLALCRGDATPEVCSDCIETAVGEILSQCPDRSSTKWYDRCMIRYSFINFFGSARTQTWDFVPNPYNVTNPAQFAKILGNLMNNLSTRAAFEPRTGMFATGEANLSSPSALYGLVQCIRDITPGDCYSCLGDAISQLPKCCVNKEGGRVRGPVCIIWFEILSYSFYGASTIEVPAPSPAPAVAGSPQSTNTTPSTNETDRGRDHNLSRIVIILIPAIVISIILVVIVALLRIMKKKTNLRKKKTSTSSMDQLDGSDILLQIDFEMIRVATNDFSDENKLGEGGFGPVYKGSFPDGREIAVKRLSINSRQGVQEFRNEVALVAKLQHRNLVRLYGCCVEGQEKLLIYEYIPNRSLDYFLFDPEKRASLNWKHRFKIIRGIARGLLYLHEDSRLRIIHRDLKPSNILLDADMNPKISDFGLAKIFGTDETHGNTRRIAGTFGYMAPEYVIHGQFSVKLDVFSFGVLLLEIVSGQKNAYESDRGGDILSYIWKAWNDGIVLEVIDSAISAHSSRSEAVRCIQIGLLCVQEDATSRPIMSSVVLMLTSLCFTLPAPSAPAFFITSTMEPALQLSSQENRLDPSPSRLPLRDINDVSITELDPR